MVVGATDSFIKDDVRGSTFVIGIKLSLYRDIISFR
ncbi:hypothetical protein OROGR_020545 [Orobanche gracilis]